MIPYFDLALTILTQFHYVENEWFYGLKFGRKSIGGRANYKSY
jgi:hypothetical protein